jgi:HSP20 family protein
MTADFSPPEEQGDFRPGERTMSIVRFDPFADLLTNGRWVPAVDIYENSKQELVLKAELPDMKREDIQVVFENNTLTLKGERKFESELKQEQFHRIERTYGSFSRSFSLPSTVDAAKIAADYKNGVLTVTLPFREEARPRTINVEVAA